MVYSLWDYYRCVLSKIKKKMDLRDKQTKNLLDHKLHAGLQASGLFLMV